MVQNELVPGVRTRFDIIDPDLIRRVLTVINRQLYEGLPKHEVERACREANWFPWLREHPYVRSLFEIVTLELKMRAVVPCEPQIVLGLPHDNKLCIITPHTDEEPPWADGRKYAAIACVPLTPHRKETGALHVWEGDVRSSQIEVEPGDVIMLEPFVPHSSGINRSGLIRYAIYFRWLEPKGDAPT